MSPALATIAAVLSTLGVASTLCAGLIHAALMLHPYALAWQDGPDDKPCVETFDDLNEAKAAYKEKKKTDVQFKLLMAGTGSPVAAYGDAKLVNEARRRYYYRKWY
jgi:hypothetical protein